MAEAEPLLIASCMAPIADDFVRAVAAYLGERLQVDARVVDDISWQKREQWMDEGRVQLGWLCGLPYVWKADATPRSPLRLLAAPVAQGARYGARPVYFSDVVVHRDSPFHAFDDLRGASWAYNERRSHSGYLITRYHLAQRNLNGDFFGRVTGAGSHQRALAMILEGEIDAAAIDSTVLALVLEAQPDIGTQIRTLESWGPSPMPPWLVHDRVPESRRDRIQELLLGMHEQEAGRAILRRAHFDRFVHVNDEDYDPIRHMARLAEHVTLGESTDE